MAKRKIDAKKLLAAGEDAHLQSYDEIVETHGGKIEGERFAEIDVDMIENNPMQPRLNVDEEDLRELANSIEEHGLIQPISVVETGAGRYILKAGQRRWLAHKLLGRKKVKAVIEESLPETDMKRLFEIALIENTQRNNLDPLEFALSVREALDSGIYKTLDDVARAINKSKSYVSKVLKVLTLCDAVIQDLRKNHSTNDIETLYEIQKIDDCKEQERVYFDFVAKKIDRAGIRKMLKSAGKGGNVSHAKQPYQIQRKGKKISVSIDLGKGVKKAPEKAEEEVRALLENVLVKNAKLLPVNEKVAEAIKRIEEGYYFGMFSEIVKNEDEEYAIRDALFALAEAIEEK